MDPYLLLNVPPGASLEAIRAAYYQRRAELSAREADDPTVPAQLQDLENAFNQLCERFKPAPLAAAPTEKPGDPILSMVDSLDTPIHLQAAPGTMRPCPTCGALNPERATICQACGCQIAKTCPNCGALVPVDRADCPRCGTAIKELHQTRLAEAEVVKERTLRERDSSDIYVTTLEAGHTERRKFGLIFWAVVFLILVGLCGLALIAPSILSQFIEAQ